MKFPDETAALLPAADNREGGLVRPIRFGHTGSAPFPETRPASQIIAEWSSLRVGRNALLSGNPARFIAEAGLCLFLSLTRAAMPRVWANHAANKMMSDAFTEARRIAADIGHG